MWKSRLGILSIQDIRWNNGDVEGAGDLIFFGKRYNNFQRRELFIVSNRILAAYINGQLIALFIIFFNISHIVIHI